MLVGLGHAQTSLDELEIGVERLCKENGFADISRGDVTHLEVEIADAWAQVKRDSAALQALSNAERDMVNTAAGDHTRVQSLLNSARQKLQSIECVTANMWTRASDHSTLVQPTGKILILPRILETNHTYGPSGLKLPVAFASVVQYTKLTLTWSSERMRNPYHRGRPPYW